MDKSQPGKMLDAAGEKADSALPNLDSLMGAAKPFLKEGKKIARKKAKKAKKAAGQGARKAKKVAAVEAGKAAALVTPTPEKKGNKLKKLFLLGGLIGVGSVIVKRLMGAPSKSNWQPAYTPPPAPAQRSQPEAEPETVDAGGAGPDEALADAAAEPHADTTPDEPVEVVELDEPVGPEDVAESLPTDELTDPLTDPLPKGSKKSAKPQD